MEDQQKWRDRAVGRMKAYFSHGFLRQTLTVILLITAVAGLGISYGLLKAGMDEMWLRYPIAVLGAYGIFLLLVRLWVELERRRIDPSHPALQEDTPVEPEASRPYERPKTNLPRRKTSWLDSLDWLNLGDLPGEEGCLIMLVIGIGVVLVAVVVAVVADAPTLLSEVFVDALLTGALYRRLRVAAKEHWLGTAIRKTWPAVICAAAFLSLGGFLLSFKAPTAKTLGQAIHQMREPQKAK